MMGDLLSSGFQKVGHMAGGAQGEHTTVALKKTGSGRPWPESVRTLERRAFRSLGCPVGPQGSRAAVGQGTVFI